MLDKILSIFIAVLVNLLIGSLWYSPLVFGRVWLKIKDLNKGDLKGEKRGYGISIISAIILASILKIFISMPRVTTLSHAVFVAVLLWAGFVLTTLMLEMAWNEKPFKLFILDAVHQLVSLILMSMALFIF